MQYHQTDADGYYIGTFDADPSPLEPDIFEPDVYDDAGNLIQAGGALIQAGAWLVPAGGVTVAPPVLAADQCARWDAVAGAWDVLPDLRGRVYWLADHSNHVIDERGVALPVGALDADPPKTAAELEAEDSATARSELAALDQASIRDIRAYIAALPDAPQTLKEREAAAVAARARVKA